VVLREGTLVRDRFLRQNLFIRLLGITVRRASAMAFVKVLKLFITMETIPRLVRSDGGGATSVVH
jgi:hypothetical protein